jgi:hypothetical protein
MARRQPPWMLLGTGISPSMDKSAVASGQQTSTRHYVGGVVFVMANMLLCFYFVAFPLNNMLFTCGYTQPGTPPSPGPWNCSRYTWQWWTVWLLTLNLLLPYLLSAALLNNTVPEYSRFLYWISWFMIWFNIAVLAMLLVQWLFFCNSGSSYYNSACNDIRWCCVYYAASPTASTWCPNTTPCIPNFGSGNLQRSDEFFQAVLFAGFWTLLAWAHRRLTKDLILQGVFMEQQQQ